MSEVNPAAPHRRAAEPGDKMFAWLARGKNAAGTSVFLCGHLACKEHKEAEADVFALLAHGEGYDGELRPVADVVVYAWEMPFWHMEDVLRANGYTTSRKPASGLVPQKVVCIGCGFKGEIPVDLNNEWFVCPGCRAVARRPT